MVLISAALIFRCLLGVLELNRKHLPVLARSTRFIPRNSSKLAAVFADKSAKPQVWASLINGRAVEAPGFLVT